MRATHLDQRATRSRLPRHSNGPGMGPSSGQEQAKSEEKTFMKCQFIQFEPACKRASVAALKIFILDTADLSVVFQKWGWWGLHGGAERYFIIPPP